LAIIALVVVGWLLIAFIERQPNQQPTAHSSAREPKSSFKAAEAVRDREPATSVPQLPIGVSGLEAARSALPEKTPRELLLEAQTSGSSELALMAAKKMKECRWRLGSGLKAREAMIASGRHQPPAQIESMQRSVDVPERACQELDDSMTSQYEPMLRQAMAGGVEGAAALWWLTPSAKALKNINGATSEIDLLRRDALACHKETLLVYQMVSIVHGGSFSGVEAAAVRVVADRLEAAGQLKGNGNLRQLARFLPSNIDLVKLTSEERVSSVASNIMAACDRRGLGGASR